MYQQCKFHMLYIPNQFSHLASFIGLGLLKGNRTYNNINTGVHTWSLTFTLSLDVLHDPCFLLSLALAPKQHNRLPNSPFCLLTACATVSKNQQDKYIPQLLYSSEIQSLQSHLHISCILLYLILSEQNN